MKSGYKIHWTPHALAELEQTIEYLENNFTKKEISNLVLKIEETIRLISQNPDLFPKSEMENIYRVPVLKFNTMYYRVKAGRIEILSFFSNRQNPGRRHI